MLLFRLVPSPASCSGGLRLAFLAGIVAAAGLPGTASACTSCGCSLGTDFADEAYFTEAGFHFDLRYDFVDQNQLRRDGHKLDKSSVKFPNTDEIQQGTLTRFYTLSADYTFNRDWGLHLQLPYLDREHETIAEGDTKVSTSHTRGVGDLRVVGRYQGFFADRSTGVQFGVKLPTGASRERFDTGPQRGEIIDRGLQSGSGTTDVLLGIYNFGRFGGSGLERFEQIEFKQALNSHRHFRPSTQTSLNLGASYTGFRYVVPQLQLNAKLEGREVGAESDYPNSGSRTLYVSPGVTAKPTAKLSVYGFVQLPVAQHYNGYQLAPHYILAAGLRYAL